MSILKRDRAGFAAASFATGLEVGRTTIARTTEASVQAEATLAAEALLPRAGTEFGPGRIERVEPNGVKWSLEARPFGPTDGVMRAYRVDADVSISRYGITKRQHLSTLKLMRVARP